MNSPVGEYRRLSRLGYRRGSEMTPPYATKTNKSDETAPRVGAGLTPHVKLQPSSLTVPQHEARQVQREGGNGARTTGRLGHSTAPAILPFLSKLTAAADCDRHRLSLGSSGATRAWTRRFTAAQRGEKPGDLYFQIPPSASGEWGKMSELCRIHF